MQKRFATYCMVSVLLACSGKPAYGQAEASIDSSLQSILDRIPGQRLSLMDAVQRSMENSTTLRKAEASLRAAEGTTRRERGTFDPLLFFNLNHLDQKAPTASFFAGASVLATQQTTSEAGLQVSLPIGTQVALSFNTVRLGTNSAFAFLNPEYDAFGSLSLRQPLLGGFSASARKRLTRSERELEAEQSRYDQQRLATTSDAEREYWDLYAAGHDYAVQILTRDRAQAFLKETELRAGAGLVGPEQVATARTFLAQQELELLDRSEQLDRQSDMLASLMGERPAAGRERFVPTDRPPSDYPLDSLDFLVGEARTRNLDLQAAQKEIDAALALADAASWEALPSVDLVGSLGGSGLGGNGRDVIFNTDTLRTEGGGSFGNALTQVIRREFPSWSIGVEVSIPIGFRSGLGEKDRLDALVAVAQQDLIEKARALENEVRSAYRELAHGAERLDAARRGVEAAKEQVRIGLIEFRNGRSTAFELVRLGEDLAVAQQRYSGALVRTAKAAATLRQTTSGAYPSASNH